MDLIPAEAVESKIYLIRNHKVMLDNDLSELYGVPTKVLNQAVRRNLSRFPEDFMFQLNDDEERSLRSRIVTSNENLRISGRGGRRYRSYVFTEQGVATRELNSFCNTKIGILAFGSMGREGDASQILSCFRITENLRYVPHPHTENGESIPHFEKLETFPVRPSKIGTFK